MHKMCQIVGSHLKVEISSDQPNIKKSTHHIRANFRILAAGSRFDVSMSTIFMHVIVAKMYYKNGDIIYELQFFIVTAILLMATMSINWASSDDACTR